MIAPLFALFLAPIAPNPALTPGVVATTDAAVVCQQGYSRSVRNVTDDMRNQVFRNYGLEREPGKYEVDHLISLELGGSNDVANLWPESYVSVPYNARDKDKLENTLHRLVCRGQLSLPEAQDLIRKDWIDAYKRYVK